MGLWIIPLTSTSDAIDEILSVERPLERRLDEEFGAGGGGFWGLRTDMNLSEFLQSVMTSLFPKKNNTFIKQKYSTLHRRGPKIDFSFLEIYLWVSQIFLN